MVGDKNKQPVIGITMSFDQGRIINAGIDYSFVRQEYGQQIRAAGGQPIFLDHTIDPAAAAQLCDGIVISGGEDIDPKFYAEAKTGARILEPKPRTHWERQLIAACDWQAKHILGICYGLQLLNVHYGGTLYQDIATEYGSDLDHGKSTAAAMHEVTFEDDFLNFSAGDSVASASRHHQAVKEIAPGFTVAARASDGIIEALSGNGHYGVQWHSESDGTAAEIYGAFVDLCSTMSKRGAPENPSLLFNQST